MKTVTAICLAFLLALTAYAAGKAHAIKGSEVWCCDGTVYLELDGQLFEYDPVWP